MNSVDVEKIVSLISAEGLFSKKFPQFIPREAQAEMLRDVLKAYVEGRSALVDAATGTGKSLAYLLGALLWAQETGERSVISTHTIALQEQLVKKDIPQLLKLLSLDLKVVLAKGMHNYVCVRKVEDCELEKRFLPESEQLELARMEDALKTAVEGSRSEVAGSMGATTWEKVAADSDSCTHMRCPHYKKCFFFKARQEAQDASIVIANHHLLFADLSARKNSNNYTDPLILPPFTRVILDEAHHLEDVAKEHFAKKLSRNSILRLMNRLISERSGGKLKALHQKIVEIDSKNPLLVTLELDFAVEKRELGLMLDKVCGLISHFVASKGGSEKLRFQERDLASLEWQAVQTQLEPLQFHAKRWLTAIQAATLTVEGTESLKPKCEGLVAEIRGLCKRLEEGFLFLHEFAFQPPLASQVKWIEVGKTNLHLVAGELDLSTLIREALFEKMKTKVLCSATLATKGSFSFVKNVLGILEADEKIYPSPFDYSTKTLFCVPLDMLHPDDPHFMKEASRLILETVMASSGHTFVLFTSYDSLKTAQGYLEKPLLQKKYPLFCQGQESVSTLLQKFRTAQNPVLFGTDSFWEGVDIVGDHLRCVIIVKLPFLAPTEPFFQAKSEVMKREKKSPFFDYLLPLAATKFKQGFGRLIRSELDRGCVLCLDPRIIHKSYGKVFINSLPQCTQVFENRKPMVEKIQQFFSSW